jgi:hypothetical protein
MGTRGTRATRGNHTLSIDELCELARSTETSYSVSTHRELINQLIKPEEEREYMSWWSTKPSCSSNRNSPTSKEGQSLAKRLTRVCRRFRLGDPTVWALSTAFIVETERDGQWLDLDAVQQAPYRFLAEATRQVRVAIR